MFEYENLKTQPRKFLSQMSLTVAEFEDLLPAFEKAYPKKYPIKRRKAEKLEKEKLAQGVRVRWIGSNRNCCLY